MSWELPFARVINEKETKYDKTKNKCIGSDAYGMDRG